MKKFTDVIAIIGAIVVVAIIARVVWCGQFYLEQTRLQAVRYEMEWASRR